MKFGYKLYVIVFSIILFSSVFLVSATEGYIVGVTTDVNFRSSANASTKNVIGSIPKGSKVEILSTNKVSGSGCSAGWYNIKYNDNVGYVCSSYIASFDIDDVYLRPWITPERAIVGGAKFISDNYINKGQYSIYLKKFNVNPKSSYEMFNHQYQTNIMAPESEAKKLYDGYSSSDALNLPFIFYIPVYDNMQSSYLRPDGKKNDLKTAEASDEKFENDIKCFPDSYKPYLRYLHQQHSNWFFIPMEVGKTLEYAAEEELNVSYVQGDNKLKRLDSNGNPMTTDEKGWYKANLDTVKYFLDPRNFLNETYIFMFQQLKFDSNITIDSVSKIIKKISAFGEFDSVDNKNYVDIYYEAGKSVNVNPAYLAALTKQEISSINASGAEFTLNDITYKGLYNFYNIGAYGSPSPVKNGLVYGSIDLCTDCTLYISALNPIDYEGLKSKYSNTSLNDLPVCESGTVTPVVENKNNSSNDQSVNIGNVSNVGITFGNYIRGFEVGMSIQTLKSKDTIITYSSEDIIKTGTLINDGQNQYTAVIYGDLTGDGQINSADLLKIRQYLLGTVKLDGPYYEAAKVTGNDTINSANLLKIRQHLLGTNKINQ